MAWIHCTICVAFVSITSACQFPYESGSWNSFQQAKNTTYTFSNNSFTQIDCNAIGCSTVRYTCKDAYHNGVYYAEIERVKPKRKTVFSCLTFLLYTEYVFQLKESDHMLYEYDDICDRKSLNLKDQLAKADHIPNDVTTECPISGGQFMAVFDSDSRPTCSLAVIQPRVEAGCMYKSSLMFDFLREDCMDDRLAMSS